MNEWGHILTIAGLILIVAGAINKDWFELAPGAFLILVGVKAQWLSWEPFGCEDVGETE